jgi:hypothetical protein
MQLNSRHIALRCSRGSPAVRRRRALTSTSGGAVAPLWDQASSRTWTFGLTSGSNTKTTGGVYPEGIERHRLSRVSYLSSRVETWCSRIGYFVLSRPNSLHFNGPYRFCGLKPPTVFTAAKRPMYQSTSPTALIGAYAVQRPLSPRPRLGPGPGPGPFDLQPNAPCSSAAFLKNFPL